MEWMSFGVHASRWVEAPRSASSSYMVAEERLQSRALVRRSVIANLVFSLRGVRRRLSPTASPRRRGRRRFRRIGTGRR